MPTQVPIGRGSILRVLPRAACDVPKRLVVSDETRHTPPVPVVKCSQCYSTPSVKVEDIENSQNCLSQMASGIDSDANRNAKERRERVLTNQRITLSLLVMVTFLLS